MIPKIADRGSSFKGAHQYYGHDKHAETSERVMFFETLNMRTDDPDKAWKVMAYTALHEEELKKANDIRWNGQETEQPVYAFSLAWDGDQKPTHEEMKEAMKSALEHRKMDALQAILYGHDDTDNLHGHVLVNLIHPETGRTAEIWHDQLELSEWAEEYEREHGGIRCEQRVENNEKRREGEFVKHRDNAIQEAWDRSETGQEFADILEEKGYILAQGNKRTVIVDPYGKTMNPTRQIEGEDGKNIKAKMLGERLADLDIEQLKTAEEAISLQSEREYFDRDNYHAQQDDKNIDAAIEAERKRGPFEDEKQRGGEDRNEDPGSFAEQLDPIREMQAAQDKSRFELEAQLKETYNREEQERLLFGAQTRAEKADTALGRLMGWRKAALEEAETHQKTLDSITQREQEQRDALEAKISAQYQQVGIEPNLSPAPEIEPPEPEIENVPDIREDYEEAASPALEVEPPAPEPQYEPPEYTNPIPDTDPSADLTTQYEQAARPAIDTAQTTEATQTQEQGQSRDSGGYER